MVSQAAELRYAVRPLLILKYFGQLSLVLAVLTLVPLAVSLIYGETSIGLRYGVIVLGLLLGGAALARLHAPANMQANEGMVLVTLMFLFTPLVMSYPMMASGLPFIDALFEAVSGVTTTGLSTTATLAGMPDTFLFSRAWMQWYGGLGIVVLSLALLIHPGLIAKGLANNESDVDDLIGGTKLHARRVLTVYVIMTVIGIGGALLVDMDGMDAVLYTMASVSTGGFAPYDNSLAQLDLAAQSWVTLLCLAGAIPLTLYYHVLRQRQHRPVDMLQLYSMIGAVLVATLLLGASMRLLDGMPWADVLHHAPMLAFSAQSTAGFASMPVADLDADSKLVLIYSMLIGGGAGSTAGGIKLLRLLIVFAVFRIFILRACVPQHAVLEPVLGKRQLQPDEIQEAMLLILLFVLVVALSWLPFVVMGYNPLDALFEVASATGTVGLTSGISSADLPSLLKAVLCVDMLMGRLEIIAWLVLLYRGTWFGRRMEAT